MHTHSIRKLVEEAVGALPAEDRKCIRRLRLFGSRLHGTQRRNSDLDLLLDLAYPVGFFTLARCERGLQNVIGMKVDLRTPEEISHFVRDDVLQEAETVYEAH